MTEDEALFKKLDDVFTELSYKHMVPDQKGLEILKNQIFNITCFVNARKIVNTYWNMSNDGVCVNNQQ